MKKFTLSFALLLSIASTSLVKAQGDPLLGQIAFVPYNFAPYGWLECKGQILSIQENLALFSLLGTTYGGNGTSTFALPDMQGRVIISDGKRPESNTTYAMGNTGGVESVTLTQNQMPVHTHNVNAVTADGNQSTPAGNLPANTKVLDKEYSDATANTKMKQAMLDFAGGSQPHENRQPFLTLKCIIATHGIYPSRP